jgi:hypothetical protein
MNRMDFEVMPCVPDGIWLTVTDAEIDTAAPDVLAALWQMYSFLLDHGLTCDADCDAPSPALCRRRLERIAALLAISHKEPAASPSCLSEALGFQPGYGSLSEQGGFVVSEHVRSFCLSCARLDALQPAELAILADRHFRLYAAAASSASTSPADMFALLHLRNCLLDRLPRQAARYEEFDLANQTEERLWQLCASPASPISPEAADILLYLYFPLTRLWWALLPPAA